MQHMGVVILALTSGYKKHMIRFIFIFISFIYFSELYSQDIVVQKVSEILPTFGYNYKKGKVVWIDFPVKLLVKNESDNEVSINSAFYYGYVIKYSINRKRWDYRLLYKYNEEDSIVGYVNVVDDIDSRAQKEYYIFTRHPVDVKDDFQVLFKDIIAERSKDSINNIWRIHPSCLSKFQNEYLRNLIANDSVRIHLYSKEKDLFSVKLPLDVNKVIHQ